MTHNFTPFPVLETERLTLRELNFSCIIFTRSGHSDNFEISLNNLSESLAILHNLI